jgi:CheY-like chemotaxis protein
MRPECSILLVEDDKVDAMTVKRAFKEIHVLNPVEWLENGEEALNFLKNSQNKRPGIILLDLNMPKMNGIEFLKIVKQDENLKKIPVVVLTTSKEEQDRIDSFNLGIAGYMIKPVDYLQFVKAIKTIDLYWSLSELPE